jgi:CBS domain-containing protein
MLQVSPETTVAEAVHAMVSHRQGCVLVTENDRLLGIFTERDVLTRVVAEEHDPKSTVVRDVMSRDPETLTADEMIAFAMNFMDVGGYRHVPLVDHDGNPKGVVSVRDVLRYLAEFFPEEVLTVPPRPNPVHPLHGG